MKAHHLLLLALPLWLASCSNGLELMGERSTETDEFYLAGGEPHIGDGVIEQARAEQWAQQHADFADEDYDDPYGAQRGYQGSTQSRLWNRYTPGWASGFNPFGYGTLANGNSGFGGTYGYNNMAFMPGYDAWGNPIGGFGNAGFGFGNNPYGMAGWGGNGWGYDPWGGGSWGTPGNGYMGGYGYGYNPYFGTMGAYGNPWGGFCGTGGLANGGVSTFTPPRPRPSLGQLNGMGNAAGGGQAGGANGSSGNTDVQPANSRRTQRGYSGGKRGDAEREAPQRDVVEPKPNRKSSGNSRFNSGSSTPTRQNNAPAPSRGRDNVSPPSPRPSLNAPSSPRSGGGSRSGGGRSGRGG